MMAATMVEVNCILTIWLLVGLEDIECSDAVEDAVVVVLSNTSFLGGFIPQFFSALDFLRLLLSPEAFVGVHRGFLR